MVGIIGYLLLAGRHPFAHPSGLFSIPESIQDPDFHPDSPRPPAALTQIQQRQFREYAAIVMRLLHRERSARFGSAREAIDAIDAVIPALECRSCGERVPEHHRFCGLCGASLETTLPELDLTRVSSRDYTQYLFDGQVYNKRKLVLAVVKKWAAINSPQAVDELRRAFPLGLRSGGLFVDVQVAKEIFAGHGIPRHFLGKDETFIFPDSTEYALSNQWGKEGILEFIRQASALGLEIREA